MSGPNGVNAPSRQQEGSCPAARPCAARRARSAPSAPGWSHRQPVRWPAPLARTSSLPPTGGRGVGMAPSLTGRGWGWVVSFAAEAVSRFPGPPLEDPPTSPPHGLTGAPWGERGGTTGARAALSPRAAQRRGRCASSPGAAVAAQPTERSRAAAALRPTCHQGSRRRATGAAVEPVIAGLQRHSRCGHFSALGLQRPGSGLGGCPGWRSVRRRTERSAAQRPASRTVRQAGLVHAQREGKGTAIPGHGKGPPPASAGSAGLTVLRQGWKPVRGETPVPRWLDAQRDSPAPRSGGRPGPQRPGISTTTPCPATARNRRSGTGISNLGDSGPTLHIKPRIRRVLAASTRRPTITW